METEKNERELQWLHHQPERLIETYQPVIEIIVTSFIKKGVFHHKDKMDHIQEINLQLLEKKLGKIKEHFNHSVQLRTYFSKVVYNACLEIFRKQHVSLVSESDDFLSNTRDTNFDPHQQLALKEETIRLRGCLMALPKLRLKATLCLKAIARVPFVNKDIEFLDTPKTVTEIAGIRNNLFSDYGDLLNKDIFDLLAALFNKMEQKDMDGDSLRKWTNQLLDRFIFILNGDPPHAAYSRETLKTLLQYYFSEENC
ncbi:MAG: sigma-70 family RNA polymerase sigma factor [Saprospiraceae bacterium]|nr:sigma-70 family RNA polymerase sigma factor [Saprospiraceae bacterium]MCB9326128.1 sigma-70 family RNA polymerase sigma factor [Lewinellaceae bacterium]